MNNTYKKNIFARSAKLIVVIAVVLGSTSGILGRLITAPPMAIGFYRLVFALPFFVVPVLVNHKETLHGLKLRDVLWSLLSGVFLFGHFFSWFTAVKTTTIASAITLADMHPIVVLLITVLLFKRHVSIKAIIGILIALLGAVIIAGFDYSFAKENLFGDFMAIMTAIFMGLYYSIGMIIRKRMPASTYISLVFGSCGLCFFIGMILTSTPFLEYPKTDFMWLLVMTLLCQIGAHAVINWSLGHVSSLYVSTWGTFEIVSATVLATLILGEIPEVLTCIGVVIVMVGLLYYNRHERDSVL